MPKEYGTPGPRALHPDTATSKSLGRCSVLAQLLFDRLISQADDQGRLEDGADYVKAICLPLVKVSAKAVQDALTELSREGMLDRYEADGRDLIQLTNWWAYQGGMRWSYPSRWPAPEGWQDRIMRPPSRGDNGKVPNDAEPSGKVPNDAEPSGTVPSSRADRLGALQPDRTVPYRTGPNLGGTGATPLGDRRELPAPGGTR